jgi:predicted XRE-type DNA-binding protein
MADLILPELPKIPNVEVRHVPGLSGYCASSTGHLYSAWRSKKIPPKWHEIKGTPNPISGLRHTTIAGKKNIIISRLILSAFLEPPSNNLDCCHNDGDPENNAINNLRWDTRKHNAQDTIHHGRSQRGERNSSAKLSNQDAIEIRRLYDIGFTQQDIAHLFHISRPRISQIIHNLSYQVTDFTNQSNYHPKRRHGYQFSFGFEEVLPPLPKNAKCEISYITKHVGYAITSTGEVWSCRGNRFQPIRKSWRKLICQPHIRSGHLLIALNGKMYYVHHLVLEAFIGPKPVGQEACHLDGNPANNNVNNLRWDTRKSNVADTKCHGRDTSGERNHWHKLTLLEVKEIRHLASLGWKQQPLAEKFGVSRSNISIILSCKSWKLLTSLDR